MAIGSCCTATSCLGLAEARPVLPRAPPRRGHLNRRWKLTLEAIAAPFDQSREIQERPPASIMYSGGTSARAGAHRRHRGPKDHPGHHQHRDGERFHGAPTEIACDSLRRARASSCDRNVAREFHAEAPTVLDDSVSPMLLRPGVAVGVVANVVEAHLQCQAAWELLTDQGQVGDEQARHVRSSDCPSLAE